MGEDIDDFVVKTRSKTNSIIQDYTAVASNNYKGVSVLDDNGNLRDTYNILLDIAKVYEEIQAEDKKAGTNRAQALIEELAGKNRSNIAASILMNPQMLEDVYNASQRSQGSAQRELDTYLDSIEAKYAQLQNRLQQLAYTAIDSDVIKVLLDGLSGAVSFATKLVDVLGTIPSILGVVSAMFMQKTGLGFLNFDKNAEQQFSLGFQKLWERAITNIKLPSKEVAKVFGQMDLDKAYLPQLLQLEKQGVIIPESMWNVDGIENFSEELTSARTAMTAFGQVSSGITGLLSNLGNVASVVGTTLLNAFGSAIVMALVSFAITGVGKVIDSVIHAKENAIQLAKETQEEIDTITSENEAREQFQNSDKYERAIELSSKIAVNKDGYKNISATNDEYQEYISLCNEIAGIYPEVVSSYDAQGNAIIDLGSNAEEAKTKLDELNKASAIAEGFELKGTSNKTWLGKREEIADALKERDEAQIELENQRTTKEVFSDNAADSLRNQLKSLQEEGTTHIDIGALSGQDYAQLEESIRDVAESLHMDLYISPTSGANGTLDLMMMKPLEDANAWEQFYSVVASSVPQAAGEASLAILESSGKVNDATNKANQILQEQLENSWEELSHSVSYMELVSGNSVLEEAIKNALFSSSLEDVDGIDDFQGWVESNYLKPITQAFSMEEGKAAQDAINNLFTLDSSKLSVTKYDQTLKDNLAIVEDFYKSIGQEELYESFLINYDFAFKTPNGQIIKNDRDAIYRELKDYLVDEKFTDETESELDTLTWDQLLNVESLVKDNSFSGKISDAIKKVVDQGIKKAPHTDTLKTLLSDETYKSDVDYANYESNLSSLTSALETLRTEGSLTAETMVSLQKSMPSLTDFTESSLKDTAFKQLDSWIQRIREGMSTMSEEGKEQTRTMIANMVNQYGDLGRSIGDIRNSYLETQDVSTMPKLNQATDEFDSQVEKLRSRLAAEGKELDYHVLYTLVASDQFSGKAEEIYNAYNNAELQWHLILDNKELEKQVQIAQQNLSAEESLRSLKEAKGETLTESDYDESLRSASEIQDALYQEAENAKKARDEIDKDVNPDTWDAANISYINALAAARDAEAKVAQLQKEQIDASLNGLRNAVTDADNEVTKAQNAITKAEENVGEGMADQKLYDTLAAALLLRSLANTNLSDAQQKLYDTYKDTALELAQGYLSDSFSSASSAQNDSKEANAQKNIQYQRNLNLLQEDATRIQRDLTMAERDHQHTSQMTYRDLIDNGRAQIENLRAQQDLVKDDISSWRNYQDQIEQMEDSIYDWSTTMEQALSTSTADQMSTGFVTEEQLNALKSAGIDYSQMLEVGAKGWKLNTDKVQEYEDALRAVQVAQSKQIESDAKDRMAAIDKEMKALLGESSDQAKMAEEAGKNAANKFVNGMSEGLGTARQGGLQAAENLDAGIGKADISERIKAGIDAQGLLDEGYFQDLAEAQNYLDLSGAREELEATIQAQQEYQIATATSIDIAKQFSEASSATNDRDLAETVSGGVKGAIETKNKGWWGDKNLQQYAKFFAPEDMPLYQALDELEKSWNETWSKYYGSDGELTDEGVQQFFKDAGVEFGSQVVHDEKYGDYTQDWLIGDIDINKLAADYNTSKENIISLLSAFEDTRSWQQVDWSSIFGNSQDISASTDAMAEYLNNLELLHKYNPDMDMSEYLQTAVSGFSGLTGEDPLQVQALVDQLNQLAELTGQNYKINITDGGNIEVIDTKLERMHELVDQLKLTKNVETGEVTADDTETLSTLKELAEFANGDGKEIMLEWGFKPAENGEFTPESLAEQVIEFDWTLKEHPGGEPGEGGYKIGSASIASIDSGVDSVVSVLGEIADYVATLAGKDRDNTNGEGESEGSESENSEDYNFINPNDPFYGKFKLEPNKEFFETHSPVSEGEVENANINIANGEVNNGSEQDTSNVVTNVAKGGSDAVSALLTGNKDPEEQGSNRTFNVSDMLSDISEWSSDKIQKALEFGSEAGDAIQGWLGKYLSDKEKTPRLMDAEGLATLEWPWLSEKTEGIGEWFSNSGDVVKGLGKALWEEIVYGFEGGNKPDHTDNPGVQAANNVVDAVTSATLSPEDGGTNGITDPKTQENLANMGQAVADALVNLVTGHNVNASEVTEGQDTSFVETQSETGQENGQSVENVSLNAQNVQVNNDTNTPGTLANGESLTPEQRQEYSSTPETPEGEAYEGEGGTETGTAVINADVAELNANLPNETDPNYQPLDTTYNPDPLNYGGLQGYDRTIQPDPWANIPMQTVEGTTVPGEVTASDVSVTAGQATISGPVEIPNTSTDTPQTNFTPAPSPAPTPAPEAPASETTTTVTVEADVTPAEEAIAGLEDKTVTIGVQIETPQPEEFQGVLDRVGNSGPQPVQVDASVQDGATEGLQEVENKANEVDGLNPTVTAETQDNASSVLNSVISTSQEVDAQAPNVGVEATDNASSTLDKVKGLADDVESTDPNVSVSASTGNTISTLTNILNTVNQLPPSKIINITTKYTTIGEKPGQASGTFHPAHALGTVKSAFADGTVGEAWNKYSKENGLGAYAGGSDVTLKHDQLALTSEIGQESIVRNGHWYLLDSHPHMEQLKKGDIVFNASQTKDLLEHGRANGHGRVAYANGTAYNSAPAFVKMTEELRKEKTGNPKIVKSTNGKGHVEIVDDTSLADKISNAVVKMGQEISQALDTPDDNTDTWSDDYAQIRLLNDQSQAIQANTAATQNNTKVKNQEATYVDFAEKVMNRLSKATARLQNRITEFTTYTFKKNTLRAELDSLADEIAAASAALPVYAEYLQMLRNTPIQHESSSDSGGGGGSDSGSDSDADDTAETNEEEAATRLETAKSNLKAAKQNLKDNYKLSDEQKKKLKNNKKIDDSEIKGSNKKNAASVYNDALKQYKQLKKQEDNATETTAKETSKAAKNTEKYTAETAQTSSQTSSNTGAIVSSADAVRASGYDIASYTALGAEAGSDTVTILQTIAGQIAGLSTQIADISVNVNIDGGSASVSSGGGGSKSSGSSDDDDGGSGGSKNGKDVDDYSWSKKNQEAIENGEKIDISTIDPSKKDKIAAAKAYNKSLKNGGGSSSSSGSSNKSSGSSNKSSSGNVKSKSGDGGVSVSSGSGKGHTASAEEKQFRKEMKAAAKDVKNSYTLTSDQQKAIKKGETLSTKGITDQTKKDAFKTYNQAVKKYNNARLSTSVSSNAPISPNNDPLHNENMRALGLIEAAQAKAGKGGGGGGGGGGSIGGIDPSSVPAGSSDKAAESIYDTLNGDYLGEFANILEDNDLIAILGLDKDLASALEEYDEFLGKLEDTKDSLEQLYQQVVSVWDELAQAPLEEADRQIEQLELGIDGLTAALGRLDNAMAGGSTLNVLDTIRETEKAAADYTATSQAVLDAIRDVNADKTENAAQQVEIRRWAVDEAKQVLEDAQKAMDEVTRDADEKIAEYKKTREETEKKLAEAQATATSTAAAVSSLEQNEYVKRYKEIEAKKALAPTGGIFSKLLGIKQTEPRQNGFLSDDMPSSPYASILTGLGARQNSNDPLKRIFGFNSGADSVIEQYTEAVKKAGEATAEVTAQQSALRESTLLLAQAELDKTLREEMQAEILQQAKLAYDQAQTALAQAESEYAAQYIQEVVDNFGAVEEAFESVLRYQKSLDENEELYVKNAEERGNRITAAMRQFQAGNLLGQTATLRAEIAALNEELSGDRLVYGSKEWNDLMSQILDKETELNDLLNQQHGILLSILSDVKEHYSVLIDHLEQVNRLNDAWIDTARAIGDYETELSYIQRYAEQQEMVALYLQQSADAQEQFNNLVARGELIAGTDEYIAKQTEVLSLINDAKNAQNDLREIEADRIKYTIERYEELLDRVDNYVDIIKALGGLISEAAKFDYDTGNLTDMGQASIAIEMTAWQENTEQLRDVLEERQRLRDEFASNPNFGEKEFAEALDANDKQIQEYLSNIKGAADNIVEIGITIAEKQLAAINKTIDARKKALQLEQDYYNYDKSLKNSTKDIELLNAQISALNGVTDAESRSLKARLEAQRQELQSNLDDQVREHVVNLQTEGLTEMQEQLADNLDKWRNELQGDIQKQLDYVNSINMSASNIEAALNKLVLGASNGVATLSDVETAVKENGLLTSTVSDVNKQYEEGHANAVATKQAQDAGAELAARIQGAINTLGTSVSTANIDKFTKEWAAVTDKANYNIGSNDQTGKDIQALINQLKSDVSQNQSVKNWVDAIAAVKSPTYNYSQAQIDAMAKSGNVAKQGYSSVITNAKAVWDKMSDEQKKAYNEIAGSFHAGKTVDQMLATYTNAVDSLNKAVATNVEKAKAEMARKAAEEAKRKAEEEAKRRAAEEAARKKAEEEARKKAEEAAKKKAEEEAKKKAEEEAKQKDPRYRLMGLYNGGGGSYDGPGYSEMLYGVQSTAAATSTKASSEKVYVLTPKANDYILKEGEVLVDQKKTKKKATGTRHAQKGMTLTQEKGGEIITTKDGVLVPLKAGDGVIPANLTDKLFRMAMDYPNIGQTIALPEMKPAETNVTVSYGSLLTVNGNVDKEALPGLQDILKQAYTYTSKQLAIDAKKAGMRQARY